MSSCAASSCICSPRASFVSATSASSPTGGAPLCYRFATALLRGTRLHTANSIPSIRGSSLSRSPVVPLLWCSDGDRREIDCRPDPTPFPTDLDHGCRMRSLSTSRKLCALRHATPPCVLSPNQSLLYPRRHPPNNHTAALESCRFRDSLLPRRIQFPQHPRVHRKRERLPSDGFIERAARSFPRLRSSS
jgi:hypothetical protein